MGIDRRLPYLTALLEKIMNKRAKAILEDESMSLSERFHELEYYNIFKREIHVPMPSPFEIWKDEFRNFIIQDCQSKGIAVPEIKIEDEFYDLAAGNAPRYYDVNYGLLFHKMECALDEESDEYAESFLVLYNPPSKHALRKTPQEIIDCVYNYCVKKRVWGFKYDW